MSGLTVDRTVAIDFVTEDVRHGFGRITFVKIRIKKSNLLEIVRRRDAIYF